MSDWLKRPYTPADESGVVYLWLKCYAHSRYGRAVHASKDHTEAERKYWDDQAPTVEYLLSVADTVIACDPDRPDIIWAFACTSGDTVHYFCVKRSVVDEVGADFAGEILRDLLGDRLDRACGLTHEVLWGAWGLDMPTTITPAGRSKPLWHMDTTWFSRKLLPSRKKAA